MENVMLNGFAELSANEMTEVDGGRLFADICYYTGYAAGVAAKVAIKTITSTGPICGPIIRF